MRGYHQSVRKVFALMLVASIALIPCACAREDSNKIVIRLANWGGAGDDGPYDRLVQDLYRQFEKENPGIEVRVENIPQDYVSKMVLSFIAHAEPDIMMLDFSSASIFINNGVLSDLTPLIKSDREFNLNDYFPNALNAAKRGDSLYAIPQDFTPMVLYYNKRMFDRAGVPYPKAGWNFDQFMQTAQRVTIPGKQWGFVFKNWMAGWIMWLWNNGGDVLSPDGKRASGFFDSPQNARTISFLRDLIDKYKISPTLSATASLGVDPFANGRGAMTVSGHWSMIDYANAPKDEHGKPQITLDDLGVVELPHDTPQANTVLYESGYAIGRNCRHKEAAWKLIKFMTSYRVQSQYNASGIAVCGRKDVAAERARIPLEAAFMPIIPSARAPWGSKVQGYDFVETTGAAAMDSILHDNVPVDEALHRAARQIDFEFAKQ